MLTYLRMLIGLFEVRVGDARRQGGATLIEYALIISAIAVVVLLGSLAVTGNLTTFFDNLGGTLDATGGGGGTT
ncbi:MAG: Flp family type IVb pilin [Salinisphaeraceae bacterium]